MNTIIWAAGEFVRKLGEMDRREQACGLPRLAEMDATWQERALELQARVNLIAADGPSQELLDAIGAHVLAFKVALANADETRVESGEAA